MMLRSAAVILVGFVVIGALSFTTDSLLRAILPGAFDASGAVSSTAVLLLIQLYVAAFAIFGCWLTARLAPSRPMLHALILGVLGLVFNIMAVGAMWETAPAWYHVVSLMLVMPYAWIGGRIRVAQLERQDGASSQAVAGA